MVNRRGQPTVFGPVTPKTRQSLVNDIQNVSSHFQSAFTRTPRIAAVARVLLKDEAIIKSHRPVELLKAVKCPIIGVGEVGELLVSVRASTIPRLEYAVLFEASMVAIANISTILTIKPFNVNEENLAALVALLERDGTTPLKLRVFRHQDQFTDSLVERELLTELARLRIKVEPLDYAKGISVFRLSGVGPTALPQIVKCVGTQSLDTFPTYRAHLLANSDGRPTLSSTASSSTRRGV